MSASAALKCFVISPIGHETRSPERFRRAKAVFEKLIEPAITLANARRGADLAPLIPIRGDHIMRQGNVMHHVVESIIRNEILIGVLLEDNVNVYYELGVAETLGRPVIYLKEQDYEAAFDVSNLRHSEFSIQALDAGIRQDQTISKLAELLVDMANRAGATRFKTPFDRPCMAPPARVLAHDRFNSNSLDHAAWSEMILKAEDEIWLAGTTLWNHLFDPGFNRFVEPGETEIAGQTVYSFEAGTINCNIKKLLEAMYLRGRHIHVLTMDDRSKLIGPMLHIPDGTADDYRHQLGSVRRDIKSTHRVLKAIMDGLVRAPEFADATRPLGSFRVTKIANRVLANRVTMTEQLGFVTPIFYSLTGLNSGPCFQIAPKSPDEFGGIGDVYGKISYFEQVRNDLILHEEENESVAVINGRYETIAARERHSR